MVSALGNSNTRKLQAKAVQSIAEKKLSEISKLLEQEKSDSMLKQQILDIILK